MFMWRRKWVSLNLNLNQTRKWVSQTAPYGYHRAANEGVVKQNDVALSLAKNLLFKEADRNVVVSPLAIQVFLSLMAAGSHSDSESHRQLLSFLKAHSLQDLTSVASRLNDIVFGSPCLSFVNEVWYDLMVRVKPSFVKRVHSLCFEAVVSREDLEDGQGTDENVLRDGFLINPNEEYTVTEKIDEWVVMNTNGLVRHAFPKGSIGPLGIKRDFVFLNALCFEGEWMHEFPPSKTQLYGYHVGSDGTLVEVPCMTSNKKEHLFKACDGFKVLGLPYTRCFTMYIFLPDSKDGLPSLAEKVFSRSSFLEQMILPKAPAPVFEFRVPKFKFSYEVMASDLLKELELILPFHYWELDMDECFSHSHTISSIFQKAFIEVNEEGTKVAVASVAIDYMNSRQPPSTIDSGVDHPFIFLIRDDITGAVLFVGQVLNPLVH